MTMIENCTGSDLHVVVLKTSLKKLSILVITIILTISVTAAQSRAARYIKRAICDNVVEC